MKHAAKCALSKWRGEPFADHSGPRVGEPVCGDDDWMQVITCFDVDANPDIVPECFHCSVLRDAALEGKPYEAR